MVHFICFSVCRNVAEWLCLNFSYSGYVLLLLVYIGFRNSLLKLIKVETRKGTVLNHCKDGHKEGEMMWKRGDLWALQGQWA